MTMLRDGTAQADAELGSRVWPALLNEPWKVHSLVPVDEQHPDVCRDACVLVR